MAAAAAAGCPLLASSGTLHPPGRSGWDARDGVWYSDVRALAWMLDVAEGLAYLHANLGDKPTIMHRCEQPFSAMGLLSCKGCEPAFGNSIPA